MINRTKSVMFIQPVVRRACFSFYSNWFCRVSSVKKQITVRWKLKNGNIVSTSATIGSSLLKVAHENNIELEGACEGVCACSTCHVILEPDIYNSLPNPDENEDDMLDLAFGLTPTSRLGCQVILHECHDGMIATMPKATRNFYVVRRDVTERITVPYMILQLRRSNLNSPLYLIEIGWTRPQTSLEKAYSRILVVYRHTTHVCSCRLFSSECIFSNNSFQ